LRRPGLPTASLSRLQYDGSTASEPSVRRHQWEREKKKTCRRRHETRQLASPAGGGRGSHRPLGGASCKRRGPWVALQIHLGRPAGRPPTRSPGELAWPSLRPCVVVERQCRISSFPVPD
jgi:hypothetical protein